MRNTLQPLTVVKPPLQLIMTLGSHELTGVSETERRAMVERLAHLILQAAGGRSRRSAMTNADLLPPALLKRKAVVYVHQSTPAQVQLNRESQRRQHELVEEARRRGFRNIGGSDIRAQARFITGLFEMAA